VAPAEEAGPASPEGARRPRGPGRGAHLAGHIHQGAVSERHEFEVITGDVRGAVVSIAPGLGQPRPDRRGEARGLQIYEADERAIAVRTYIWRDEDWGLTAVRRFARGREPLAVEATD